jgi:hypothetical protein
VEPSSTTSTSASQPRSATQDKTRSNAHSMRALSLNAGITILSSGCAIGAEHQPSWGQIPPAPGDDAVHHTATIGRMNTIICFTFPKWKRSSLGPLPCLGTPTGRWIRPRTLLHSKTCRMIFPSSRLRRHLRLRHPPRSADMPPLGVRTATPLVPFLRAIGLLHASIVRHGFMSPRSVDPLPRSASS